MAPTMRSRRRADWLALVVAAAVGLTGCSAAEPLVTDSPTPSPSTSQPTPRPTPTPTPPPPVPEPDSEATLQVSPIDFNGNTLVIAQFGTPEAGAEVTLQRESDEEWQDLATGAQDDDGRAEFLVPSGDGDYRAISVGEDAWVTPAGAADDQWTKVLSTEFKGDSLPKPWNYADTGSYRTGGRQCSAAYPSNVRLKDGNLVLSVTEETKASRKAAADKAGCKRSRYFRNATVSTGTGGFRIRTGTVAARIKFGPEQGMHGSVFLLSGTLATEIDVIESYGYGSGVASVAHRKGKKYPEGADSSYVATELVKDRDWWDDYHVFSAEWDKDEVVYRIDGVETRRLKPPSLDDNFILYLSLLASDWEQRRFKDPVRNAEGVTLTELPARMYVDWVRAWEPE